jgi:heme/copper-type cytochrome/quinol oxidase subunit 2
MKRLTAMLMPVLVLIMTTAAWACPFCKDSVPSSDAQSPGNLSSGFNTSIYFMFAAFFGVLGMITMTLVRGARSSARIQKARGFPLE